MNEFGVEIRGELLFITIVEIIGCLLVHNIPTNYSISRNFNKMQRRIIPWWQI